jgi:hypothetical protein
MAKAIIDHQVGHNTSGESRLQTRKDGIVAHCPPECWVREHYQLESVQRDKLIQGFSDAKGNLATACRSESVHDEVAS